MARNVTADPHSTNTSSWWTSKFTVTSLDRGGGKPPYRCRGVRAAGDQEEPDDAQTGATSLRYFLPKIAPMTASTGPGTLWRSAAFSSAVAPSSIHAKNVPAVGGPERRLNCLAICL